jgi:hypothetical protein
VNDLLFEALLQSIIRQMARLYYNANGEGWAEDSLDCCEWWPPQMKNVDMPGFRLVIDGESDRWATITCGCRTVEVEISGKRIGMYGPSNGGDMTDAECVEWFNRSILEMNRGATNPTTITMSGGLARPRPPPHAKTKRLS